MKNVNKHRLIDASEANVIAVSQMMAGILNFQSAQINVVTFVEVHPNFELTFTCYRLGLLGKTRYVSEEKFRYNICFQYFWDFSTWTSISSWLLPATDDQLK